MNWWNRRRVVMAGMFVLVVFGFGYLIGTQQNPAPQITNNYTNYFGITAPTAVSKNAPVTPANDAQRVMLDQFRLATDAEAALLQDLPDFQADPAFQHIYVATRPEVTLAPINTPMVLILSVDQRWVSGPLSMVTILRVPAVTETGLRNQGVSFADPLCTLQVHGVLKGECTSPWVQTPATWNNMIRNTRYPTRGELREWLGAEYGDVADPKDYLVAVRDLYLAPQYQFDGDADYNGVVALFVPQGIKVLGGQLGYMDVIPVDDGPYTAIATDDMCFWHYGPRVLVEPANFAPATEVKRVERCMRR